MQVTSDKQEAVQLLTLAQDNKQRHAIDVAAKNNRKLIEQRMLYLQRYKTAEGRKVHHSASCIVIIAEDVKLVSPVAIKLMENEDQWQREKEMRLCDSCGQLKMHVLEIFAATVDKNAREDASQFPFVVVMPAAEIDLSDHLSHSRIAGVDFLAVTTLLRQVAVHLLYIHEHCGFIHGDLKPRNVVSVESKWYLIDLDASSKIGAPAGQKLTSSAFFPPEIARFEIEKASSESTAVDIIAPQSNVQLEMWYFGLLLLQLSTRDAPTLWQSTQADNMVCSSDIDLLAYAWDTIKLDRMGMSLIEACQEWNTAMDLA